MNVLSLRDERRKQKLNIILIVCSFELIYHIFSDVECLVLHTCASRFDVMWNVKNFIKYFEN